VRRNQGKQKRKEVKEAQEAKEMKEVALRKMRVSEVMFSGR